VYTLFDTLVDGYFAVEDRVRERMESIEDAIFTGKEGAAADLFRLRKELLRVPRLLAPTSHVLAEVLRRERAIPEGLRPYFGDVQDRALHVLAELDTYRDLLAAALHVYVFHAFNHLGQISSAALRAIRNARVDEPPGHHAGEKRSHDDETISPARPVRIESAIRHSCAGDHAASVSTLSTATAPLD
jgi:hypothetical protein